MQEFKRNGFISIELVILVIILVAGLLTFSQALVSAYGEARDQERFTDVAQMQKALQIFYKENGYYPESASSEVPNGIGNYLDRWPVAPKADGNCSSAQNQYIYSQISSGTDFSLTFCLGTNSNSLVAGTHILTSKGIQ